MRPNVLTEHILITWREKSILQITLLSSALQELFISQEPQPARHFCSPRTAGNGTQMNLGGFFTLPARKGGEGKMCRHWNPVKIIDSGSGFGHTSEYSPCLVTLSSDLLPWDRGEESDLSPGWQDLPVYPQGVQA